jgi:hypothetical protein
VWGFGWVVFRAESLVVYIQHLLWVPAIRTCTCIRRDRVPEMSREMLSRKLRGHRKARIQPQIKSSRTFGIYAHFHAPICTRRTPVS